MKTAQWRTQTLHIKGTDRTYYQATVFSLRYHNSSVSLPLPFATPPLTFFSRPVALCVCCLSGFMLPYIIVESGFFSTFSLSQSWYSYCVCVLRFFSRLRLAGFSLFLLLLLLSTCLQFPFCVYLSIVVFDFTLKGRVGHANCHPPTPLSTKPE